LIDDAFKLTIDKIFTQNNSNDDGKKPLNEVKDEKIENTRVNYSINGKNDNENLW